MPPLTVDKEERSKLILDAAANIIMRLGYDKTTMGDIAEAVGLSRGLVYLHFESKDQLLEALIRREIGQYIYAWLAYIEADPRGGTIGGIYRAVLHAITRQPFMSAMMRRDRRVLGNYLRKPGNLFAALQSSSISIEMLKALQDAGTVRADIDVPVMAHIMDTLSYGLVTITEFRTPEELPPFETVMTTLADMLDTLLTPADGGNTEAGKAVIRSLATFSLEQFESSTKVAKG